MTSDSTSYTVTTAWVWGGALLIASAVIPSALQGVQVTPGAGLGEALYWAGVLTFTAAMLLFAFGWRGRGSVVGSQRYGIIALIALALWPLASIIVLDATPRDLPQNTSLLWLFGYIDLAVRIAAATLAVTAIWRGGAVPRPWNRVPAWGLAVVVGVGVLTQLLMVATASQDQMLLTLLWQASSLVTFVVPVGLGILAIVLGLRTTPRPAVPVYRGSE